MSNYRTLEEQLAYGWSNLAGAVASRDIEQTRKWTFFLLKINKLLKERGDKLPVIEYD